MCFMCIKHIKNLKADDNLTKKNITPNHKSPFYSNCKHFSSEPESHNREIKEWEPRVADPRLHLHFNYSHSIIFITAQWIKFEEVRLKAVTWKEIWKKYLVYPDICKLQVFFLYFLKVLTGFCCFPQEGKDKMFLISRLQDLTEHWTRGDQVWVCHGLQKLFLILLYGIFIYIE